MIKFKIELPDQKIEFSTLEAAEDYIDLHNLSVEIQMIDDAEATSVKPKHYKHLTPRQARQALILSGVSLATIDAAIDSLPEPQKSLAKVEWEYSVEVQRHNPLIAQMSVVLGLSSEQLDAIWELGVTL